jgi:hypothetical protein
MLRHELMRLIAALPADADVGVQIGDETLDIADVVPWGDGAFAALRCHPGDLRDLLADWRLPLDLRRRVLPGGAGEELSAEIAAFPGSNIDGVV